MPKIGIIGCGGMGRHHANVLTNKLGHTIVAASEAFDDAREKFGADYPKTEMFSGHAEMIEKARPDVVWNCLPTFLHTDVTVECVQAGVHIMIEKPMALTSAECDTMGKAAADAGVKLMVAFCRRFDNFWGTLRKLLTEDEVIGRPVVWRQMNAMGSPRPWFNEKDKGGGPFIDGCVHNYDFCLWAFGEAKSVKSSLITLGSGTALDTGVADIVFEGGDRTSLNWSWGLPPGARGDGGQDVLGSGGALLFGIPDGHKPKGFDPGAQGGFHVIRGRDEIEVFTYEKNDMYEGEDRHFLECIENDTQPCVGAADGAASTALAERVFADAERQGS